MYVHLYLIYFYVLDYEIAQKIESYLSQYVERYTYLKAISSLIGWFELNFNDQKRHTKG